MTDSKEILTLRTCLIRFTIVNRCNLTLRTFSLCVCKIIFQQLNLNCETQRIKKWKLKSLRSRDPMSKLQKDNHYQQMSIKTNREEHSDALHWRPNSWCARARNLPIFSFFPSLLALHGGSRHHQSPIHGLPISSSTPLFPRAKSDPQGQDTHLPSICRSLTRSCCPSNSV